MYSSGAPYILDICHRSSRWTESNTFLKSVKLIENGFWDFINESVMFLSVNIYAADDLLDLNPHLGDMYADSPLVITVS